VIGRTFPLHAGAVPKAMLAWLSVPERSAILERLQDLPAFTPKTVLDRCALERELEAIRERGFAISDEDFDAAARGVGAPIFSPHDHVVAGSSVGGPSFRLDADTLPRFAQLVRAAAEGITRRLTVTGRP